MARAPCFAIFLGILLATPASGQLPDGFKSNIDKPNPSAVLRIRQRQASRSRPAVQTGKARALVLLVEFAGTDSFEFVPTGNNKSTWDPLGAIDSSEWTGAIGDCSNIVKKLNLNAARTFTYSGPLHNKIPRPISAADRSGDSIWNEDFSRQFYQELFFGDGPKLQYRRTDGSEVNLDLRGKSLRAYYQDMSGGRYDVDGEVYGWLQLPHSIWWYGADGCPGARSAPATSQPETSGAIPNAGTKQGFVRDALDALRRANPTMDWKSFDQDNDGQIDHLWIVHAGMGEEEPEVLLGRSSYGEASLWSNASTLSPYFPVAPGVSAGNFSILPENAGTSVTAHEFAHLLGANDLYSQRGGQNSAGFWTVMSDSWTGSPAGISPGPFDPLHLDNWGWLNPLVITDPGQEYTVKIGQTSAFPAGESVYRGVKIELPDGVQQLPVTPRDANQWWAGRLNLADARMTLTKPLSLPNTSPLTLSLDIAYNLEPRYDYLWVQISTDSGRTWKTLTNSNTSCKPYSDWIGGLKGFLGDLCAQGVGGFTGASKSFPAYGAEVFNLQPYAGQEVLLRVWSMTDWNLQLDGVYVDNIAVKAGSQTVFADNAESGDANWAYSEGWARVGGSAPHKHSYYLQWRNPGPAGGFDSNLYSPYRFGPAAPGLLVWYNNERYADNESTLHLFDPPSFGPKGVLLVVDAHPAPVRDPLGVAAGFDNEGANLSSAQQMRDAPFSLYDSPAFESFGPFLPDRWRFAGRPATPVFRDAWGYTAGLELASRGPGDSPVRWEWITRQWDSSVVLPSTKNYAPFAPGYPGTAGIRYNCSANTANGQLSCGEMVKDQGFEKPGGGGNPGDVQGQYGWNVEILEQSDTQATLRIWNEKTIPLPPLVSIDAPAPGVEISGATQIEVTAIDEQAVASVELFANGVSKGVATEPPFWTAWETALDPNGLYTITLRACDVAGLCAETERKLLVRNPDAPSVKITSPKAGATVTAPVNVTAAISGSLANAQLYVDGRLLAEATSAAPVLRWDVSQSGPGLHTLTVLATNDEGRQGLASVTVYVPGS